DGIRDFHVTGVQTCALPISPMREPSGGFLDSEGAAGSEGLAINNGMALVSFEGDDRVLAFDIGRCGAAAQGTPIVFENYGLALRSEERRVGKEGGGRGRQKQ